MSLNLSEGKKDFLKRQIEKAERDLASVIIDHDRYASTHENNIVDAIEKLYARLDILNKILYYDEMKSVYNLMS